MAMSVIGFRPWAGETRSEAALRGALTRWARANLMRIYTQNPELVTWGLPANLKFDPATRRLYHTYAKGLNRKPKIVYLQVN
jgi:hypothetical protein